MPNNHQVHINQVTVSQEKHKFKLREGQIKVVRPTLFLSNIKQTRARVNDIIKFATCNFKRLQRVERFFKPKGSCTSNAILSKDQKTSKTFRVAGEFIKLTEWTSRRTLYRNFKDLPTEMQRRKAKTNRVFILVDLQAWKV